MTIEAVNAGVVGSRQNQPAEQVDRVREQSKQAPEELVSSEKSKDIQPEELLNEIKAMTENGIYSVRFENNNDTLIVKVVDSKTDEVIRQIPPEELMELTKRLQELEGNIVNTVS